MKILLVDSPCTSEGAREIRKHLEEETGHVWIVIVGGRAVYDCDDGFPVEAPIDFDPDENPSESGGWRG